VSQEGKPRKRHISPESVEHFDSPSTSRQKSVEHIDSPSTSRQKMEETIRKIKIEKDEDDALATSIKRGVLYAGTQNLDGSSDDK
jgi:hypothetical protein